MTRPAILLAFADALAGPEAFFSLSAAGFDVDVLVRRDRPLPILARRLPVRQVHQVTAPETSLERCLDDLRALDRSQWVAAIGIDDIALRLLGGDERVLGPLPLASAHGDQAAFALDKARQIEMARSAGFAVPEAGEIVVPADAARIENFPAILRPRHAIMIRDGRILKQPVHFLMTADDRVTVQARLKETELPLIAQPLVRGIGEGLFGFATARGMVNLSAHRRLRMMNPHGSGASACVSLPVDPVLAAAAGRLVEAIGWRGPFMIEMLRGREGTPWFIEFNGRLWGSTALARRCGLEYPAWAARQAIEPDFEPPAVEAKIGLIVRHLGRDIVHCLMALRGPKTRFHAEDWPNVFGSAAAALAPAPGAGFYNHDPRHPRFFLHDALETVASQIRKAR
jgi:hypothetical protein